MKEQIEICDRCNCEMVGFVDDPEQANFCVDCAEELINDERKNEVL